MGTFIMACLAGCTVSVLLALCIQFLRIEREVVDTAQQAEISLKKRYSP